MTTNGTSKRSTVSAPDSPALTTSQLATLAELGEERTASAGDALYRVGDQRYPFVAVIEGEVAVLDAAGNEITRQGPARFLGEVNLLSGQAAFVTAVAEAGALHRRRPGGAARAAVRRRAAQRSCWRRSSRAARRCSRSPGSGSRSSARTPRRRRAGSWSSCAATGCRSPGATRSAADDPDAAALVAGLDPSACRSSACRAESRCTRRHRRAVAGARHRTRAGGPRGGRPAHRRSRPGRPRRGGVRRLRGARDAGRREQRARWTGR